MSPAHHRLQLVVDRLSQRDRDVLRLVGSFRLIQAAQVQALYFEEHQARLRRRVLSRLVDFGLIETLARRVGGVRAGSSGLIYQLTADGQRVLDLMTHTESGESHRRLREPGQRFAAHTLAIADLYVNLKRAEADGTLELDRFDPEPRSWRAFIGPFGARRMLKPDAFAVTAQGGWDHLWFIEVDMATEGRQTLKRKIDLYVDYWRAGLEQAEQGVFPRVLWLTTSDRQLARIDELITALPTPERAIFAAALFGQELPPIMHENGKNGVDSFNTDGVK